MNDETAQPNTDDDPVALLRARAEALEQSLAILQRQSDVRLIRSEMKTEAVRAGIIDLDDLRLLDLSAVKLTAAGEVEDAADIIARLKRAKPWLFGTATSSSLAVAPSTQPPRQKLATEMSDGEYAVARLALLRQRY